MLLKEITTLPPLVQTPDMPPLLHGNNPPGPPGGVERRRHVTPMHTNPTAQNIGYCTDGKKAYQVNGINNNALRKFFTVGGPLEHLRRQFNLLDDGSFNELFDKHMRTSFDSPREFVDYISQNYR